MFYIGYPFGVEVGDERTSTYGTTSLSLNVPIMFFQSKQTELRVSGNGFYHMELVALQIKVVFIFIIW